MAARRTFRVWVFLFIFIFKQAACNLIQRENRLKGTRDWLVPQLRHRPSLEGFSTDISYVPLDTVAFKINCSTDPMVFSLEIYRLGYYQGMGGRLIDSLPFPTSSCSSQPACDFAELTRMVDCDNWRISLKWTIPKIALSGVYLALPVVRSAANISSLELIGGYIPFIVRQSPSAIGSDLLFKTSDTTWVAYNKFGGWNVYGFNNSKDFSTRAFAASYNRPFANRLLYPVGQQQNFVLGSEFPMLYWLEKYGYDVSYVACRDVEDLNRFSLLTKYKVLLSVGHDEYWTQGMKDAFYSARDGGVHEAFFSGNEIFWRVLWLEDYFNELKTFNISHGLATVKPGGSRRVLVCFKESIDNVSVPHSALWTGTFVDPRHGRLPDPENALTGQLFMVNSYQNESIVLNAEEMGLRFWRNASFHRRSKRLQHYRSPAGVLGYEVDIHVDDVFRPPGLVGLSTTVMKISHALSENYGASYRGTGVVVHRLALYRHQLRFSSVGPLQSRVDHCAMPRAAQNHSTPDHHRTALVFGAGTLQWSWALSSLRDGDHMHTDLNLQQATMNLFADMSVFPDKQLADETGRISLWNDSHEMVRRGHFLVFPMSSKDHVSPASVIARPVRLAELVRVRGTARDLQGKVASVEVTVDGGHTWHVATGTMHWRYDHFLSHPASHLSVHKTFGFTNEGGWLDSKVHDINSPEYIVRAQLRKQGGLYSEGKKIFNSRAGRMLIAARAVDDSGNLERVDLVPALCSLLQDEPLDLYHANVLVYNL